MEQLLNITSVPIRYEMTVTRPRMELQAQQTQVNYSTQKGGLSIYHQPTRLSMNTVAARSSMGLVSFGQTAKQIAGRGAQAAQDAMAQYSSEAKQMLQVPPGEDALNQIAAQRTASPTGEFQLDFIPSVGPEIQFSEPSFQMSYQTDKLRFDARVSNGNLEFVPGDISLNVTQFPDVQIEYMGKPMYVPPSAAERFEASA